MHLRVFTKLKGNTTCTGAVAQQSTRVSVCEHCRHFRMTPISTFIESEDETLANLHWKHTLEDSTYRYHLMYLNFTFAPQRFDAIWELVPSLGFLPSLYSDIILVPSR